MAKLRFFVFFDGTWQTDTSNTNVGLIHQALKADEMKYGMTSEANPCSIHYKKDDETVANVPETETVKMYLPGVGNQDDYNKLAQFLFAATGDGTVDIAKHAVNCVETACKELGLLPEEVEISAMGFSRGSTSATYFAKIMKTNGFNIDSIVLLDRVRSEHLIGRVRTARFDMSLPEANGTLHLVSAHDKRNFPDEDYLPDGMDLLTAFDSEALWHDPNFAHKVKEIYMAGVHGDIGGNKDNVPQDQDARRVATYFLINQNYSFNPNFLDSLINTESECHPVQKTDEFKTIPGEILNKILFHDRRAKVLNVEGVSDEEALPTVHVRVFERLRRNQKFQDTDIDYEINFLKDRKKIKVINDDGVTQVIQRKRKGSREWFTVGDTKLEPETIFDFARARQRAKLMVEGKEAPTLIAKPFKPHSYAPVAQVKIPLVSSPVVTCWLNRIGLSNPFDFKCWPERAPAPLSESKREKLRNRNLTDF